MCRTWNVVAHFVHPGPRPPCCHCLAPFPDFESGFGHSVDDNNINNNNNNNNNV